MIAENATLDDLADYLIEIFLRFKREDEYYRDCSSKGYFDPIRNQVCIDLCNDNHLNERNNILNRARELKGEQGFNYVIMKFNSFIEFQEKFA